MTDDDSVNEFNDEKKSRTKVKKEMADLQQLGEKLVGLSPDQINKMSLNADLKDAVLFAKTLKKHGAIKRQMQYIGVLMREADTAPIENALNLIELGQRVDATHFLKVEKWRDDLIEGNTETFEELVALFPELDRQHVNQLVRNAVKEREKEKPPKSARALFRYLNELSQSEI